MNRREFINACGITWFVGLGTSKAVDTVAENIGNDSGSCKRYQALEVHCECSSGLNGSGCDFKFPIPPGEFKEGMEKYHEILHFHCKCGMFYQFVASQTNWKVYATGYPEMSKGYSAVLVTI